MRIQSNFRDYYDSMQQYLTSGSFVWNRSWCSMKMSNHNLVVNRFADWEHILIGFCGKIYGVVQINHYTYTYKPYRSKFSHSTLHINSDEINTKVFTNKGKLIGYKNSKRDIWTQRLYDEYFTVTESNDLFIENNCPIFIIDNGYAVCCPIMPNNHTKDNYILKDFRFNEIVPAEQAYNDLINYMEFLGREHKQVPEISNADMIQSHGFNSNSFRKRK